MVAHVWRTVRPPHGQVEGARHGFINDMLVGDQSWHELLVLAEESEEKGRADTEPARPVMAFHTSRIVH